MLTDGGHTQQSLTILQFDFLLRAIIFPSPLPPSASVVLAAINGRPLLPTEPRVGAGRVGWVEPPRCKLALAGTGVEALAALLRAGLQRTHTQSVGVTNEHMHMLPSLSVPQPPPDRGGSHRPAGGSHSRLCVQWTTSVALRYSGSTHPSDTPSSSNSCSRRDNSCTSGLISSFFRKIRLARETSCTVDLYLA